MKLSNLTNEYPLDRDLFEAEALEQVCACQYYDLADSMDATSDIELINIINHNYNCQMCGLRGGN